MDKEDIYLLGCLFAIHQLQEKGSSSFAHRVNGKWVTISWSEICTWIEKQCGIEASPTGAERSE